jgi:hypothetical protein
MPTMLMLAMATVRKARKILMGSLIFILTD